MTARILVLVSAACACLSTGTAAAATPADDAWQAAENLFASGEFPDAAEAYAGFRGRHADDPRATEAGLRQGEALFRAGRLDPALAEFASAARDPRARFRLGNVLYLLGRPAEAIPHLRGLLADSGTPPELEGPARYFLIRSLVSMGKTDEARRAMVGFVLRDDAAAAYTGLALGDIEAAGLGASVPDGRQAGEADPQQRSAAAEAAVAAYRDALPRAGEGRLRAETLLRMAEVQRRAGRTGEARKSSSACRRASWKRSESRNSAPSS